MKRSGAQKVKEGKLVQRLSGGHPIAGYSDLAVTAGVGQDDEFVLLRLPRLHQLTVEAQGIEAPAVDPGRQVVAHSPPWRPALPGQGEHVGVHPPFGNAATDRDGGRPDREVPQLRIVPERFSDGERRESDDGSQDVRKKQSYRYHGRKYTLVQPRAYLLDLDGTLYSGDGAIPGAPQALARLRKQGIPHRLVTNTTSRSRAMLVQRLRDYGFDVFPEEVFTATLAGTDVVKDAGYGCVAPFVMEPALSDLQGLELCGGTSGRAASRTPEAVLVGDLGERWTYALLQEAFDYLMSGAALIALSRDRYWLHAGRLALDAGPFVAALECAAGKPAVVAGKPSPAFYAAALRSLGLDAPASAVMVGDDLWSDVQGAQRAGLQGWLVRTGKYREGVLRESGIEPDRILDSVAALG